MPTTPQHLEEVHAAIACLQRLSDAFTERRRQLAESVGLTEQQWAVLEEISTEHFMPSMFARVRQSSAAAVSKTLRQLLDKELVRVSVSPDDGRQRRYGLTGKGAAVQRELRRQRESAIRAIWLKVTPGRLKVFTRIGNELAERLGAYAPQPSQENSHGQDTV
ncbi:MAG: MarR family transcriptional regulator [Polyangiaceae bacterium]|nr:MarR family transcriptional regulator [Polyangiaceae bacterium]